MLVLLPLLIATVGVSGYDWATTTGSQGNARTNPPTSTIPATTPAPCEDVDTTACVRLDKEVNVCHDESLAFSICKRYCGKCPLQCKACAHPVKDVAECNSTITCDNNQACFTMEVFEFDQSHGYRGGCISKDLCTPHGDAPTILGRSSSTVHVQCCDTDFCNLQPPTTTTSTTTTTTTVATTTHTRCHDKMDCVSAIYPCLLHLERCQRHCKAC